jgi:AraC-like DNA-binding protein
MRLDDLVFVYRLRDENLLAWHSRPHSHEACLYELHYFISGEGRFHDDGAVFGVESGSLFVTRPRSVHRVEAVEEARRPLTYYAALLDAEGDEEAAGLLDRLSRRTGPFDLGLSQRFFFADLMRRRASGGAELEAAARYGLLSFLYNLAEARPPRDSRTEADRHIEKALSVMQSSVDAGLDLVALCERLNISCEHFVRIFSERMGLSPMRYYSRLRIEAARSMLQDTELRIWEIADRLGYSDQFAFSRAFKRISGLSPKAYRSVCAGQAGAAIAAPVPQSGRRSQDGRRVRPPGQSPIPRALVFQGSRPARDMP